MWINTVYKNEGETNIQDNTKQQMGKNGPNKP